MNYDKISPTPGYVLIKVQEYDRKIGMITTVESEKEQANTGIVVKDGGPAELENKYHLRFQAGDTIIYSRWSGMELEDTSYKIIAYKDIFAKVEEK